MEKSFTFRFYNIGRDDPGKPAMVDVLRQAAGEPDKLKREQKLAQDVTIRLEELQDDGADAVIGEFVRCQDTNLPSELDGATRKPLTAKKLGHSVVFRLNHKKGVIGIQHDPRIVSLGRILEYLHAYHAAAFYTVEPRLDPKAWQKFKKGSVRKLALRIASPDTMADLGGTDNAASTGIRSLAEAYDAPTIGIELSMGHRKGFLSNAIFDFADKLTNSLGPTARLDKLTAITVINEETEVLDLIEERQMLKDTLAIDDRDPVKNYQVKTAYLAAQMKRIVG
ncbi:hypothetical protein HFO94_12470 [Rhizobium leguminosarum]|uniref:hypothetical protein n=1 Tax=Rhizobium leguminosarum TaxID=384 RepID=UPI001C947F4B|nr:hypothetical protein [Rhizobium leguminosarum]MBY5354340.1 hypothetical protein [Rhizobium leguminosarum]